MVDFSHTWSAAALSGDWLLEPPGLSAEADLRTAVIISLMTDRLALTDDRLPDEATTRRGWWADTGTPGLEVGNIGSRLWLLCREKRTEDVRRRAIEYSREALRWLIEDGIAKSIEVEAEWNGVDRLDLLITIFRNDGEPIRQRLDWVWDQLNGLASQPA